MRPLRLYFSLVNRALATSDAVWCWRRTWSRRRRAEGWAAFLRSQPAVKACTLFPQTTPPLSPAQNGFSLHQDENCQRGYHKGPIEERDWTSAERYYGAWQPAFCCNCGQYYDHYLQYDGMCDCYSPAYSDVSDTTPSVGLHCRAIHEAWQERLAQWEVYKAWQQWNCQEMRELLRPAPEGTRECLELLRGSHPPQVAHDPAELLRASMPTT